MDDTYPSTRAEAKRVGATYYYTGKLCKYGHRDVRLVSNQRCYSCNRGSYDRWRRDNPTKKKEIERKWREDHKEYDRARCRGWHADNREHQSLSSRKFRRDNPGYEAEWRRKNPDKVRGKASRRKAAKLERTPFWADHTVINAYYTTSQRVQDALGVAMHVDHIVPLQGKNVCGLHCADNLQILTAEQNLSKNNAFDASQLNDTKPVAAPEPEPV